jgi:hypothetical protein
MSKNTSKKPRYVNNDVLVVPGLYEPELVKAVCPECGKKLLPKSNKVADKYHKKCFEEFTRIILFIDKFR